MSVNGALESVTVFVTYAHSAMNARIGWTWHLRKCIVGKMSLWNRRWFKNFSSVEFVNSFIIYSARVNAFRQGISLLCMFATHDKGFADKRSPVEWNFIQLIFCAVKMFRTMPSVGESESKPYLLFLLTFNPLSDNPTKWPNTLKQFVDKLHFWNFRRHLD